MRRGRILKSRWIAAALLIGGVTTPALAQSAGEDGRVRYDAGFFAPYAPGSAKDIIDRIPGFTFQGSDLDVRGFGGAAGNVVINGQRPSSKSDSLSTILSRIPANRVLRVEVGPGDLFGAEFSGRPQVANLVLDDVGGLSGTFDGRLARGYTGRLAPRGTLSGLWSSGRSSFSAALAYDNSDYVEAGPDLIYTLPDRTLIERRDKVNDVHDQETALSASWAFDGGANRSAHLNGRVAYGDYNLEQRSHVTPIGGTVRDDRLGELYESWSYEVGGDITRPLAGGGLKLLGLYSRRDRDHADVAYNRVAGRTIGGYEQNLTDRHDEAIGRVTWSRGDVAGWSVETGVEGAFTRLDSKVDLYLIDNAGARQRVDLPVDQAIVSEYRGEAFVTAGRALTPRLRIDGGLTYEASRLTVRGDADAKRSLSFLKPKLTLDWRPKGQWHLQLSATRTVAQLDFEDFISSAELTNDRVNGGNADLLPQRAWEFLITAERPLLGDGRLQIKVGTNRISLLQDRVPTPEGYDAPGNLGNARESFVGGTLDVPLGVLGIKGGRLTLRGTLWDSAVRDPYTHRNRHFSGWNSWEAVAEFRQDLGRFAWGGGYYSSPAATSYRRDEIDMRNGGEPYISVFAEYRPAQRTTLRLSVDNLFAVPSRRTRTFYAPDRSNPDPWLIEYRSRNQHAVVMLKLKHSFQ